MNIKRTKTINLGEYLFVFVTTQHLEYMSSFVMIFVPKALEPAPNNLGAIHI